MRGLLENIETKKWPVLFLVSIFLLMTLWALPADKEISAGVQATTVVQNDTNATVKHSTTDYYNTSRGGASSRPAATPTSAGTQAGAAHFTLMLSLILLSATVVNAGLFWKVNTKN